MHGITSTEVSGVIIMTAMSRRIAIRDGNPITGQQNFSGAATAMLVFEALGK